MHECIWGLLLIFNEANSLNVRKHFFQVQNFYRHQHSVFGACINNWPKKLNRLTNTLQIWKFLEQNTRKHHKKERATFVFPLCQTFFFLTYSFSSVFTYRKMQNALKNIERICLIFFSHWTHQDQSLPVGYYWFISNFPSFGI